MYPEYEVHWSVHASVNLGHICTFTSYTPLITVAGICRELKPQMRDISFTKAYLNLISLHILSKCYSALDQWNKKSLHCVTKDLHAISMAKNELSFTSPHVSYAKLKLCTCLCMWVSVCVVCVCKTNSQDLSTAKLIHTMLSLSGDAEKTNHIVVHVYIFESWGRVMHTIIHTSYLSD